MSVLGILLILATSTTVAAQLLLYRQEIRFQIARRNTLSHKVDAQSAPRQQTEIDYTVAKMRLAACATVIDGLMLAGMMLGGGLAFIHALWSNSVLPASLAEILSVITIVIIGAGTHRLLSAYKQFVIDSQFGISKIPARLFIKDTLVNGALIAVTAFLMAAICVLAAAKIGAGRWFIVWLAWTCFSWGRTWLYQGRGAQTFARLRDLSDEVLARKIRELMERSKCSAGKLQEADSSGHSTHANAKVAGMGNTKRIIFLDTLLALLTRAEIVAVTAHELGHLYNWHVIKFLVLQTTISFVWIVGFGQILESPSLQAAIGTPMASDGELLALLWLLTPIFAFIAKPLVSTMLRSFEFEADRFVIRYDNPLALQSALGKLHAQNASASVSDPLYGFVHNSHPSLRDRLDWLSDKKCGKTTR